MDNVQVHFQQVFNVLMGSQLLVWLLGSIRQAQEISHGVGGSIERQFMAVDQHHIITTLHKQHWHERQNFFHC